MDQCNGRDFGRFAFWNIKSLTFDGNFRGKLNEIICFRMEQTFPIYLWLLHAKQLRGGGPEVLMLNFDNISDVRYNVSLSETGGGALVLCDMESESGRLRPTGDCLFLHKDKMSQNSGN